LDDALIFAGRFNHFAALEKVVAGRFLDVNILARLAGPHCCQRVPMVRRRDGNRVHILVVEHPAQIGAGLDAAAQFPGLGFQHLAVHVANSHHPHAAEPVQGLDMAGALAAKANHRNADVVIGPDSPAPGASVQTESGGAEGNGFEEITTIQVHNSIVLSLDSVGEGGGQFNSFFLNWQKTAHCLPAARHSARPFLRR